jgi:hypothetical protein
LFANWQPCKIVNHRLKLCLCGDHSREGLLWSREITANVNAAVDHHSHRMMELGQLINPVAKRVQTLSAASEKIKAARTWADATLRFLDTARQVDGHFNRWFFELQGVLFGGACMLQHQHVSCMCRMRAPTLSTPLPFSPSYFFALVEPLLHVETPI